MTKVSFYLDAEYVLRTKGKFPEGLTLDEAWELVELKWSQLLKLAEEGESIYLDGGIRTCAFCFLYWDDDRKTSCRGCPIFEKTGGVFCYDTPYRDDDLSALETAQGMVEFLKDLRSANA